MSRDTACVLPEGASRRAQLRRNGQLTLPSEVRKALHINEGDEVEFRVTDSGEVAVRGFTTIPAEQRWFWTEEWQAGEREASEELDRGEVSTFDNDLDAFFDHLKS